MRIKLLIAGQFVAILILAYFLWLKPSPQDLVLSNTKPLRDSITMLQIENKRLDSISMSLDSAYSVLSDAKEIIKIKYREKLLYIYTLNPRQLDSVIRANW